MKTKWTIGLIAAVYITAYLYFGFWKGVFNGGDTWGYYIHLPSIVYTRMQGITVNHRQHGGNIIRSTKIPWKNSTFLLPGNEW